MNRFKWLVGKFFCFIRRDHRYSEISEKRSSLILQCSTCGQVTRKLKEGWVSGEELIKEFLEKDGGALGRNIKSLRESKGLSLEKAARVVGYTRKRFLAIERGEEAISSTAVTKLADALGVHYCRVLMDSDEEVEAHLKRHNLK